MQHQRIILEIVQKLLEQHYKHTIFYCVDLQTEIPAKIWQKDINNTFPLQLEAKYINEVNFAQKMHPCNQNSSATQAICYFWIKKPNRSSANSFIDERTGNFICLCMINEP